MRVLTRALRSRTRDNAVRSCTGTVLLYSVFVSLHSIVPTLLELYDRARPSILRYCTCIHSFALYDLDRVRAQYPSILVLLHSVVPILLVPYDRVRPSILWYEPACTLSCCTISIAYGNSTHVYWYCCTPSCLHSSCRTTANAPVCCGTNSHLRALLRDARSRSRAGTVLLVYWYCCTTSRLHSSCCKTNLYLRALLGAVRSRSPWDHVVRMLTLVNSTMYAIRLRSSCVRELVL